MNKYLTKAALLLTMYQHGETGRTQWRKEGDEELKEPWFKTDIKTYKKKGWSKKAEMSDLEMAKKSKGEEQQAIDDYTRRLTIAKNPYLRQVFHHALGEEKEHHKLFSEAVKKLEETK